MLRTSNYTEINLIGNYAPTARVDFAVVDAAGKAVDKAKVEFKIYNYAEYYTAVNKFTDTRGRTFLTAGVVEGGAHFDVNGVDGQCLDLHEDVVASGSRWGGDGGIDQDIRDVHRASGSSDDSGHGALGVRAAWGHR